MASMFSSPKLPAQQPTPQVPTIADPGVAAAAEAERVNAANRKGRGSTILTAGLGDISQANVEKKKLLGATAAA